MTPSALASLPNQRDESKLLRSMGFETANVHLGTRKAPNTILADLRAVDPQEPFVAELEKRVGARRRGAVDVSGLLL